MEPPELCASFQTVHPKLDLICSEQNRAPLTLRNVADFLRILNQSMANFGLHINFTLCKFSPGIWSHSIPGLSYIHCKFFTSGDWSEKNFALYDLTDTNFNVEERQVLDTVFHDVQSGMSIQLSSKVHVDDDFQGWTDLVRQILLRVLETSWSLHTEPGK